jgi:hypothetical protein
MCVRRRGIRRWIWWLLASLPLFCAACLICINGWLASDSGCAWMARKIQARTGLETSIGRATILPWSGVMVYEMKLLQPPALRSVVKEPLFRMDSLQLRPVWEAWWQGKMELNSMTLDRPRAVLPVELVADILRSRVAVQKANPAPPPATTAPPPPAAAAGRTQRFRTGAGSRRSCRSRAPPRTVPGGCSARRPCGGSSGPGARARPVRAPPPPQRRVPSSD